MHSGFCRNAREPPAMQAALLRESSPEPFRFLLLLTHSPLQQHHQLIRMPVSIRAQLE